VMSTGSYLRRNWLLYALLALPLTFFAVFRYGSMYGVVIAFKEYNIFQGVMNSPWVGLDVFKQIFAMNTFWDSLRNTFLLNVLDLIVSFPAPIALALILNELRTGVFKKFAQTVLYLPHFISWVIIGGMVYQVFATNNGFLNEFLGLLGIGPIPFLTNQGNWLATYLLVGVWQSAGWGTIIYLAAMTSIHPELYEAAAMDGAGRWRRMRNITLPGIAPTVLLMLIIKIGDIVQIGFDRPYVMGNASVGDVSEVLSTFVYKLGMTSGQFSMAAAVGLFQSAVGLVFLFGANAAARKWAGRGIF